MQMSAETGGMGLDALLRYFRSAYCYENDSNEASGVEAAQQVKPNNFSDFAAYFLQKV